MERLNLFNPFTRRPVAHEDHLTWAFLIALRYEPILQRFLRDAVSRLVPDERIPRGWNWEPASVNTQTDRIDQGASFVVSVLLSDEPVDDPIPVKWVDRRPRYDGVVQFSNGLVLVIENKPARENVWRGQLSLSRDSLMDDTDSVDLYDRAVSLAWPDILEGFLEFAASDQASFAGREIACDLLELVEAARPELSPYRTVRLCGGRPEALQKRIRGLLDSLASTTGLEVATRSGGQALLSRPGGIAQQAQVYVQCDSEGQPAIWQSLWPGDTVSQARRFFERVDSPQFLGLSELGWTVRPNLHFAFMGTHLVSARTSMSAREYLELFASGTEQYGQWPVDVDQLMPTIERWVAMGLVSHEDILSLTKHFFQTSRTHINVIPGFQVSRSWRLEEAISLEDEGRLEDALILAFEEGLSTWGEILRTLPPV